MGKLVYVTERALVEAAVRVVVEPLEHGLRHLLVQQGCVWTP